jgi:hypothetical protein
MAARHASPDGARVRRRGGRVALVIGGVLLVAAAALAVVVIGPDRLGLPGRGIAVARAIGAGTGDDDGAADGAADGLAEAQPDESADAYPTEEPTEEPTDELTPEATPPPVTPTPTPVVVVTTPPVGPTFADAVAVACAGRPRADQVIAVARAVPRLLPASVTVTVKVGPLCAGTWQYTVLAAPDREPLQVLTRGAPSALAFVTAGTNVCTANAITGAPAGILAAAHC